MKTPQDLIDLPHAGMAENELRKSNRWRLDPSEKHEWTVRVYGYFDYTSDYAVTKSDAVHDAIMCSDMHKVLDTNFIALEGNT